MAINRGPFYGLVDDDGSGATGSIWNKAAIQNVLLDPIDGQLPIFQAVPFNAADFTGDAGMVWNVGAPAVIENRYALIGGKVMVWSFYISWFSGSNVLSGTPGPNLNVRIPGGMQGASNTMVPVTYQGGIAGVAVECGLKAAPNAGWLRISKSNDSNFALSDVPGIISTFMFEVQ